MVHPKISWPFRRIRSQKIRSSVWWPLGQDQLMSRIILCNSKKFQRWASEDLEIVKIFEGFKIAGMFPFAISQGWPLNCYGKQRRFLVEGNCKFNFWDKVIYYKQKSSLHISFRKQFNESQRNNPYIYIYQGGRSGKTRWRILLFTDDCITNNRTQFRTLHRGS